MTPDERLAKFKELISLALNCRAAQRAYYRERNQWNLITAKDWEHKLDVLLKELEGEEV